MLILENKLLTTRPTVRGSNEERMKENGKLDQEMDREREWGWTLVDCFPSDVCITLAIRKTKLVKLKFKRFRHKQNE